MSMVDLRVTQKLCEKHSWIQDFYLNLIEESQATLTQAETKSVVDDNCIRLRIVRCQTALKNLKEERNQDAYGESVYGEELDNVQTKLEHMIVELEDFMRFGPRGPTARLRKLSWETTPKTIIKGEKRKQVAQRYVGAFTLFVGGIFKRVNVKDKLGRMKNMQNLVSITDHHECSSKGLRNVKIYDTDSDTLKRRFSATLVRAPAGTINGITRSIDPLK